MYNRYIPRSDGSFQKNRIPDTNAHPSPRPQEPPRKVPPSPPPKPPQPEPMISYIRRLLPKGFDTGDLIVVLLMLLMAGDCEEERNNAMLTLAIYFFL